MHLSLCTRDPVGPTSRRGFLEISAGALGGLGLANALPHGALGAALPATRPKAVIQLYMGGGASHIDSFDPKPLAPSEIRGPFESIATTLPGIAVTEHLPQMSRHLDKMALLR